MGGVVVDTDTRTALPGLYVAGEDLAGRMGQTGLAVMALPIQPYMAVLPVMSWAKIVENKGLHDPDETVLDEELARAVAPFAQKPGDWRRYVIGCKMCGKMLG